MVLMGLVSPFLAKSNQGKDNAETRRQGRGKRRMQRFAEGEKNAKEKQIPRSADSARDDSVLPVSKRGSFQYQPMGVSSRLTKTCLVSRYSSRPQGPRSRPKPDCL